MSSTVLGVKLMTADEFGRLPDDGRPSDLVRGRFFELNPPFTSHGYYMNRVGSLLTLFVEQHGLGRVVGGAGLVTERDPDTVRGPDVAYYSYERIPRGPLPEGYWPASPELVFEIRSENDRWKDLVRKAGEYLGADVLVVAVLDPISKQLHAFSADRGTMVLNAADTFTVPEVLPGFEVVVGRFFNESVCAASDGT